MNLIQGLLKIRLGIDKRDWQSIIDGYEAISGEKIELTEEKKIEPPKKEPNKRGRPRKPRNENMPVVGANQRPNKFFDDGTLHLEDKVFDNIVHNRPPVPRRQPIKMLSLKCDNCSKTYEVNPEYFTSGSTKLCNKCSRKGM